MRENRDGLPEPQPHVVAVGSLQVVGEWQKNGGGLGGVAELVSKKELGEPWTHSTRKPKPKGMEVG